MEVQITAGAWARRPTFIELFAGAGGLSMGLERAGWECLLHVEKDAHAAAVLRATRPGVPILGDVTTVDFTPWRGKVTKVSGGAPCQDLSVAGKRLGLTGGTRSILFYELIRAWDETQAPYFLYENVPGALSSSHGDDFAAVLSACVGGPVSVPTVTNRKGVTRRGKWASSGSAVGPTGMVAWRVLDLQHFGPPQRRRRLFVLAARAGAAHPGEVLLELDGVCGHPAPRGKTRQGAASAAAASAGGGQYAPDVAGTLGTITGGLRSTDLDVNGAWPVVLRDGEAVAINNDSRAGVDDVASPLRGDDRAQQSVFDLATARFHCRACHADFGVNDYESNTVTCPSCGATHINVIADRLQDDPADLADVPAPSPRAIGFNWQNGGGYGEANDGLGITEEGTGPLSRSQVPAVALAFNVKQDGSTADTVAPTLTSMNNIDGNANGGGQLGVVEGEALAFEPRYYTRDNKTGGAPTDTPTINASILKAGDAAPHVAHEEPTPLQEVGKRTGASTDDPRAGIGIGQPGDPMYTLQAGAQHGVVAVNMEHALAPHGSAAAQDTVAALGASEHKGHTVVFKPSHFTRGKDGAPADVVPPLSADADKGDQDPIVIAMRGREDGNVPEVATDGLVNALRGAPGGSTRDLVVAPDPIGFYPTGGTHGVSAGDTSPAIKVGSGIGIPSAPGVVAFDTTQVTHPENRSNPQPGDPCHTLPVYGDAPLIVPADETTLYKRRGGFGWSESEGLAPTLEAEGGTHQGGPEKVPITIGVDLAPTLGARDHKGPGNFQDGQLQSTVFPTGRPRRLLPVECERLMGWPDEHTAIGVREDGTTYRMTDTQRYKMCGNGVGSPVATAIGYALRVAIAALATYDEGVGDGAA